jgi:hypothetical protein
MWFVVVAVIRLWTPPPSAREPKAPAVVKGVVKGVAWHRACPRRGKRPVPRAQRLDAPMNADVARP